MTIRRYLAKYDKATDRLVEEYELHDITLDELQRLFGELSGDPMHHSYDVSETQRSRLEQAASVIIDLKNYDYCVDVNAG